MTPQKKKRVAALSKATPPNKNWAAALWLPKPTSRKAALKKDPRPLAKHRGTHGRLRTSQAPRPGKSTRPGRGEAQRDLGSSDGNWNGPPDGRKISASLDVWTAKARASNPNLVGISSKWTFGVVDSPFTREKPGLRIDPKPPGSKPPTSSVRFLGAILEPFGVL